MAASSTLHDGRTTRLFGWRNTLAMLTILAVTAGATSTLAGVALFGLPQVVDSSSRPLGGGTSIAVQPGGQVHVGYQGADAWLMKYATNAYGWNPWATIQTVSGTLDVPERKYSSLAVDAAGNVHICYYDSKLHWIMYATNRSGDWAVYPVEAATTPYSAIATNPDDSDNRAHILMINDAGQVRHFTVDPITGPSAPETLPATGNCSGALQIAVDGDNHAHALYLTTAGYLYYATNASGAWGTPRLVEAVVPSNSRMALCVDAAGYAHAAYTKAAALRYSTNAGGNWLQSPADAATALADSGDVAVFVSADADSNATVDWFSPATGKITRATSASGWQEAWSELVNDPNDAADASIATAADKVHLVYTRTGTGQLMYVTSATQDPAGTDVRVTQTRSPSEVRSRENVEYTITVTNLGKQDATNVQMVDYLPAGTTFVSASQGAYDEATHRVTWTITSLGQGQTVATTITVKAPFRGDLVNQAAASLQEDFRTANNAASDESNPLSIIPLIHPLVLSVADSVGGKLETVQPPQERYDEGSTVPVVATPDPGYRVQGWVGTVDDTSTSSTNQVQIGSGASTTVQVRFEKIPRELIVVAGANGSVSPLSAVRPHGEVVTLTATPKPHYRVKKWTGTDHDDWTGDSNLVTMDGNRAVTVEFELGSNQAPVALAVLPAVACPGDVVELDGTQSYDPDQDPLTYKWEVTDLPVDDSTSVKARFTAPQVDEELIVEVSLAVNDGLAGDTQLYVIKVQPTGIPTRGCGGGSVNPAAVVCMYSLCWLGLACMKWGPGSRRRGRPN